MRRPLEKKERHVIAYLLVLWVFLLAFGVPDYAYAYIDPAATTYIIQVITAVIVTVGVSFSIVIYRFRMLIAKAWVKLTSGFRAKKGQPDDSRDEVAEKSAQDSRESSEALPQDFEFVTAGSSEAPQKAFGFAFETGREYEELAQNYAILQDQQEDQKKLDSKDKTSTPSTSRGGTQKGRLADLLLDKRRFRLRLGLSALVSASLVFTLFIFGPLELFAASDQDMLFELGDFIAGLLLIAFVVFFILTALLLILKGRLLDTALCLLMGILVACSIQSAFFNGFIGVLTGDAIPWHEHVADILISLFIWFIVIAVFFILHFINTKAWQMTTVLVCTVLIVSQIAGLVSVSDNLTRTSSPEDQNLILSTEGTLEVSSQQNTIVFLLDRLDTDYINEIRNQDPQFFDSLDGFTEYTNNISRYSFTYPAITYSLTGVTNDGEMPSTEYFPIAYGEHLFVDDLVEAGWIAKLYLNRGYDYNALTQLSGRATNLIDTSSVVHSESWQENLMTSLRIAKKLDQLSAFRYAPSALKPVFWMGSTEISSNTQVGEYEEYNSMYQTELMHDLTTFGLSADIESPAFTYYHLEGSHAPYLLSSSGYPSLDGETDEIAQAKGCFAIVYEYINQLKALGVYDKTCIIILGDHGVWGETQTGLFYKPTEASGKPLAQSAQPVSEINLVPTIVEQSGVKSTALAANGLTYSDVTEKNTPSREKLVYVRADEEGTEGQHYLYRYEIVGLASDFSNWHLVEQMHADVSNLG